MANSFLDPPMVQSTTMKVVADRNAEAIET
jgi:hypothetical protein